jgi:hypothetical protein
MGKGEEEGRPSDGWEEMRLLWWWRGGERRIGGGALLMVCVRERKRGIYGCPFAAWWHANEV